MDLLHLAQAAVVEAGENAGSALLLGAFLQLGLAVLPDRSEVRLGIEELLAKGFPLPSECLCQLGSSPGVHCDLPV